MARYALFFLLALMLCNAVMAAGTPTVVLNGKTVAVPVTTVNGKTYVDVVALMKLLGGSATVSAKTVVITTGGKATPATPASTSSAASGTAQLPGDNGALGTIYTMCKDNPLYFCMKSIAFTTGQVVIGDRLYSPKADEKLLLLNFTIQNPQKTELFVRWDSLNFTAVDAMNINHEGNNDWGDAESHASVGISLKPSQKISAYTVITVPAKGMIPKLMVLPGNGNGPVLRYDLHGKVTALQSPVADPSDPTGSTALDTVPAQLNTAFPMNNFNITVEKFDYTTDSLGDNAPGDGNRYLVATIRMKNVAPSETFLRSDTITALLTSTDGEQLSYNNMLFATSNHPIEQNAKVGQEMRVRIYFTVPQGSTPKTLDIKEGDSRTYEFSVQ